jgi:Zn-dependent protease with chaperone function
VRKDLAAAVPRGGDAMAIHFTMGRKATALMAAGMLMLAAGCSVETANPSPPRPAPRADAPAPAKRTLSGGHAERLKGVLVPLLQVMDHPIPLKNVKVGVMDDPQINAASAGNGEFYVTTGLLEKSNDQQLTGVLAHEVAHDDLGHVAKAQRLGAGLNIGVVLLDAIFPGSGNITPIAGALVSRAYSRKEEYAADKHGAELLERSGYSKQVMIDTLTWLIQTSGPDKGGGFFATHPATEDRIQALKSASAR